jgi:N-acetylmuramoyl-L-alanine amidase
MLVLHYTGMESAEAALERLSDPAARVSAHWVVDEDGSVIAMVPEAERAWHAGVSFWQGREGLNDVAIGIELVNPGHELGYRPFPEPQMRACIELCRGILARWPIPPRRVLAHSDIAPLRKEDPGELLDWRRLAAAGIGLWPDPADPGDVDLVQALTTFGYGPPADASHLAAIVTAFQRHFRPERVDGIADDETRARLAGLLGRL